MDKTYYAIVYRVLARIVHCARNHPDRNAQLAMMRLLGKLEYQHFGPDVLMGLGDLTEKYLAGY